MFGRSDIDDIDQLLELEAVRSLEKRCAEHNLTATDITLIWHGTTQEALHGGISIPSECDTTDPQLHVWLYETTAAAHP
jgi:hypothetical protein